MIPKIYIPRVQGPKADHLKKVDIEGLATDAGPSWEDVSPADTPDGSVGMVASWTDHEHPEWNPPRGIPKDFEWKPCPPFKDKGIEKGDWWFGWNPQSPPTPMQLARKKQYQGSKVTLCDNQEWTIPSAYYMPGKYGIDPDTGEKTVSMPPQFQRYCYKAFEHASAVFSREEEIRLLAKLSKGIKLSDVENEKAKALILDKTEGVTDINDLSPEDLGVTVPFEDSIDHCWHALELNYRVNPVICSYLELIDRVVVGAVCCAAIDIPKIKIHLKKNDPEKPILLPGGWSI